MSQSIEAKLAMQNLRGKAIFEQVEISRKLTVLQDNHTNFSTLKTNYVPVGFSAITLGPVILIRPECKGDAGLIAHERVHVRQWKESWGMFWPRYLLSRRWRRDYEVEAYREQLRYSPECLDLFAGYLANNYKLGISVDIARSLLTKP